MFKVFNLKVDAIGLSIFRVFYSVIIFCELQQLYEFRKIIFDKDPFLDTGELDVSFLFYFWFVVILLLFLGLFTRFATILNYIFSVIIFSSASKFEYHVFYAYVGINFLLMFMPVARVFSLDSLLQKIKFSTIYKTYQVDTKILQINYLIPVFVGIGLVYIDSMFHKFSSEIWMNGLGVWLPSSMTMITWNDTSFLLNQEWLVKFLGYFVLIFETVFIFLFWFKRWRIPLLVFGIFFHIGILITYPIPYFALVNIALYLLLVPVSFWKSIADKLKFKKTIYTFYYDAKCPLCTKVVIIIKHFDLFNTIQCKTVQDNYLNDDALKNFDQEVLLINIHGVNSKGKISVGYWAYIQLLKSLLYTFPLGLLGSLPGISFLGQKVYHYISGNRLTERCTTENCLIPVYSEPVKENQDFLIRGLNQLGITQLFWKMAIIIMVLGQLFMISFSPIIQDNISEKYSLNDVMASRCERLEWFYVKYLGITHHPVFMDRIHFNKYNYIFKIECITGDDKIEIVPLLDENGFCKNSYINGALWVNFTFRVNEYNFDLNNFQKGIIPYLKHHQNDKNGHIKKYLIYVKKVVVGKQWEKDFLKKQITKPWVKVGESKIAKEFAVFQWNNRIRNILKKEVHEK